jgi:energy-coupling factor transporter ATP-binding protein EcfA2
MKIRSIELTNFRKLVGTVRVDSIGDNVSVLVGRNELGKSTLLQAINGVIFEKARSTAIHVKAFRHFVNGTVPEVKLSFELDGKNWVIHKRFAGQAGKAVLTAPNGVIHEDEAAEAVLQRILGFTGGRGGGEPGIWGTFWVQQWQAFGDVKLNEQAQRTIQGCLEAQVGLVTGSVRGQRIPKIVREAIDTIQSQSGPRGKFKDAVERVGEVGAEVAELEVKAKSVSELLTDLSRTRRDLKEAQAGLDDTAHRAEVDGERNKRILDAPLQGFDDILDNFRVGGLFQKFSKPEDVQECHISNRIVEERFRLFPAGFLRNHKPSKR